MIKHAPGPWHAVEYAGYWHLQAEDFYSDLDDLLDEEKCKQSEANALLAAAAPELLEALEMAYQGLRAAYPTFEEWPQAKEIKSAINKAKGVHHDTAK